MNVAIERHLLKLQKGRRKSCEANIDRRAAMDSQGCGEGGREEASRGEQQVGWWEEAPERPEKASCQVWRALWQLVQPLRLPEEVRVCSGTGWNTPGPQRTHTHTHMRWTASALESSDTHDHVSKSQRIVLFLFSDGILTVRPCRQSFFFISGLFSLLSLTLESSQQAGHLTQVNHTQPACKTKPLNAPNALRNEFLRSE